MRWTAAFIAAATVTLAAGPRLAVAEQDVTDPRAYCDHIADLIGIQDFDTLTSDLIAHSNGTIPIGDMKAGLSSLPAFWSKAGSMQSQEHVAEKMYGETVARHWYLFVYDLGPLYVRCSLYRPGQRWLFLDMTVNDKPESVGLGQ